MRQSMPAGKQRVSSKQANICPDVQSKKQLCKHGKQATIEDSKQQCNGNANYIHHQQQQHNDYD
jgi:hypothetical protein